ncbi:MAG: triose-phosphate isomerase [Alphaproteobacteria bacterium]|nr:triose-phosphate isomerase [Alphaproteobacteria bacterium]
MSDRRPMIAGNWKMNGLREEALALIADLAERTGGPPSHCDVVLCPPATLLHAVDGAGRRGFGWGGQDCHAEANGAHTGDISAEMLRDAGCGHVIVGHSERRADHGETDAQVRAKAEAAQRAGLVAILCVGETEAERDAGDAEGVVVRQLAGSAPSALAPETAIIAYEPVWAIGTGRTPTLEEIAAMHGRIRAWLDERTGQGAGFRILYGGSVKPDNAAEILALADVDGALVGGASLKAADFHAIIAACPGN